MDRPDTTNIMTRTIIQQSRADEYELLKSKRCEGNSCDSCKHSKASQAELRCGLKGNKRVNKLAICHHFE